VTLRSEPPLTFRPTAEGTAHLVGTAAGPLGGDDLRLDVVVGAGATVRLRGVAASLAQPGPRGDPSHLVTDVEVAEGGDLDWSPEPTVLVRGCDHRTDTTIRLAACARLAWREVVVLGRHAEAPGSIRQRLVVDVAGRPLLRHELAVGPRWPGSLGPAGIGDARAVGTLLVVGPDAAEVGASFDPPPAVRAAGLPLAEQACVITVLGPDPAGVLKTLP
jgi:urease accessory protein